MKYVIDGTTGLLGRNLLFEILKQNLNCLDDIEIVILGKGTNGKTIEERMNEIILDDGMFYLEIDDNSDFYIQLKSRISYVEFDLSKTDLGISIEDLKKLKEMKIDFFYHIAGLTNFGDSEQLIQKLQLVNFDSSKLLLRLTKELGVKEFIYVSTAYSAGSSQHEIYPDFINSTGIFRNPYEKSKLETELYLMNFAKREKLEYKIFRPTTIAGRIIEKEYGSINKFDVFYEWARWIMKYKMKMLNNPDNPYEIPFELNFRITKHPHSGMNILPADYAAKLLYHSTHDGLEEKNYHLAHDFDISTHLVAQSILETLKIQGYCFVDKEPEEKNQFEQFYYRTVGKIFTPYIIDPPLHYNNDNLKKLEKDKNLKCPELNRGNFQKLLDYAKKYDFGINRS